jgi:D-aminoacyl-tRNA deacylase
MIAINDLTIKHENIEQEIQQILKIKPTQAIYISRHTSKTEEPTLTTHPIGNYGEAEFGGITRKLTPSAPRLMTQLLRIIKKNAKIEKTYHKVCFEVTHHGPHLNIPTFYTEVGSNQKEWKKQKPAEIIAESLIELFDNYQCEEDLPKDIPVIIGIGGGHYAPRFTDIALSKNVAFGHMIPSYQIEAGNINEKILKDTFNVTPNVEGVYIHKKALKKSQVTDYKKWFKESNIQVISSKELKDL